MKIPTASVLWSTGNTRKYLQINVYIYQCVPAQIEQLTNKLIKHDSLSHCDRIQDFQDFLFLQKEHKIKLVN